MKRYLLAIMVLVLSAFSSSSGCFEGGATFNQKTAGNNDTGGVDLAGNSSAARRDIAVDPLGGYLLARNGDLLIVGDIANRKVHTLSAVGVPERAAFAWKESRFYLTSTGPNGGLYAVDADALNILWQVSTAQFSGSPRVYTSPDDNWVVMADGGKLEILNTDKGTTVRTWSASTAIVDVDITPDSSKVVVTQQNKNKLGQPKTVVTLLSTTGAKDQEVTVPNCSSPLVLDPDGDNAYLAPTQCGSDPVSVIDLKGARFVRNLPGFGPVAMAAGGDTVVAFMDVQTMDKTLFDSKSDIPSAKSGRYHLMLIDAATLKFKSVPLGDNLPRYAAAKNGQVVLVDSVWFGLKDHVRILDIKTLALSDVTGPEVYLDHFVISPNNEDVFLLKDDALHFLSIPNRAVKALDTALSCQSLNMTRDGKVLFIMDWTDQVHLFDPVLHKVTGVLAMGNGKTK